MRVSKELLKLNNEKYLFMKKTVVKTSKVINISSIRGFKPENRESEEEGMTRTEDCMELVVPVRDQKSKG